MKLSKIVPVVLASVLVFATPATVCMNRQIAGAAGKPCWSEKMSFFFQLSVEIFNESCLAGFSRKSPKGEELFKKARKKRKRTIEDQLKKIELLRRSFQKPNAIKRIENSKFAPQIPKVKKWLKQSEQEVLSLEKELSWLKSLTASNFLGKEKIE